MPDVAIPAELWRGGTSRGLIIEQSTAADFGLKLRDMLQGALGSPDPLQRQIDGVGGGSSSTSKAAPVAPSLASGSDVDFTFAQVAVDRPEVEFAGNCGNFVSVVGPYAVDRGWVVPSQPRSTVRIRCLSTNTSVEASVPVSVGRFEPEGSFRIAGVPGSGSRIDLAWAVASSAQLPLGEETLEVGGIQLRCVDVGNPVVVVDGRSLGFETPAAFDRLNHTRLDMLEDLRNDVAERAGWLSADGQVAAAIPKVALVWCHSKLRTVARALSMGAVHRTIPLTVAMALGSDLALSGGGSGKRMVTIEHPAGELRLRVDAIDGVVVAIHTTRTARRLMRGEVLVPNRRIHP